LSSALEGVLNSADKAIDEKQAKSLIAQDQSLID